MPHIHTAPNQHDITVSAYIVRIGDEPRVLVHMHRKHHLLLQIGGHVELDETPWQTFTREIAEESGYTLAELEILQPDETLLEIAHVTAHPVPVFMNTYIVENGHYHSDLAYAFIASNAPARVMSAGESADMRWLTIPELIAAAEQGIAAKDITAIYERILSRYVPTYARIPATRYSLGKPRTSSM